jgi:predicted component of type VI protein secretion system
MGKLVLKLPDGRTRDIPLDRERIVIGRRADNDVCLPFPAVSAEHAAVVTILDDSFLEDLNSTNGTLVNGRPIAKHFLRDGDEIDVGRQVLVYVAGEFAVAPGGAVGALATAEAKAKPGRPASAVPASSARGPAAPEPAGTPEGSGDAAAPQRADPQPAAAASRSEARASSGSGRRVDTMPHAPDAEIAAVAEVAAAGRGAAASDARLPALEVLEGAGAGRVVPIDRDVFVIGRAGRQVAAAMRTPDGLRLVHVEGDAPPRINGAALPDEGSLLALGDEIEIAGARLRFHPGR